jgi:hypothetical protein
MARLSRGGLASSLGMQFHRGLPPWPIRAIFVFNIAFRQF